MLAATPVLCFGAVSGLAAWLSRRLGEERVLFGALILVSAGLLLRGALPGTMLFPGTIVACGAIAIMNVLLSSMIKRRAPARAGLLIGIYLTSLSTGAVIASLISVPLFDATGGSVQMTLGLWGLPAVAATLVWITQLRYRSRAARSAPPHQHPHRTAPHRTSTRTAPHRTSPAPASRPARGPGDRRVPARAGVAGHRLHGPAEPAVLRGRVLAAGTVPGPGRQRGGGRDPAGRAGPRQPAHLAEHPGAGAAHARTSASWSSRSWS